MQFHTDSMAQAMLLYYIIIWFSIFFIIWFNNPNYSFQNTNISQYNKQTFSDTQEFEFNDNMQKL